MSTASHLLMIEPVNFGFNAETAVNNSFQVDSGKDVQQKALKEFNAFVSVLKENNIDVTVIRDTEIPFTPDSIFPNNWISFHEDGQIFLYPMFAKNRRKERKPHILETLKAKFHIKSITDLTHHEDENLFLEGTGSMILDRVNKIAYSAKSPRSHPYLVDEYCRLNNYSSELFTAVDEKGEDIYHTNVMMCVADRYAVVCLEAVVDGKDKLLKGLEKTGKEIIAITQRQLKHFAGNILQVMNADNEILLVMSTQAFNSITTEQVNALTKYNRIIHSSLDTIESAGGGSARCMMAEVFCKKLL